MRHSIVGLLAFLLLTSQALASSNVQEAWQKFKGRIIVSSHEIPTEFNDQKEMVQSLRKLHASELTAHNGSWTMHFVGFLSKPAGADSLHLVFYRGAGNKREYVSSREIHLDPQVKVIGSEVTVSGEDGLSPGAYEVVLARKKGSKETIYARTKLTLQ